MKISIDKAYGKDKSATTIIYGGTRSGRTHFINQLIRDLKDSGEIVSVIKIKNK